MFVPWLVQTMVALLFATGTIVWLIVTIIRSATMSIEGWEITLLTYHSINMICTAYCVLCVIALFQDLSDRLSGARSLRRRRRLTTSSRVGNGEIDHGTNMTDVTPRPPVMSVLTPPPYCDKPPPYTTFPRGVPQQVSSTPNGQLSSVPSPPAGTADVAIGEEPEDEEDQEGDPPPYSVALTPPVRPPRPSSLGPVQEVSEPVVTEVAPVVKQDETQEAATYSRSDSGASERPETLEALYETLPNEDLAQKEEEQVEESPEEEEQPEPDCSLTERDGDSVLHIPDDILAIVVPGMSTPSTLPTVGLTPDSPVTPSVIAETPAEDVAISSINDALYSTIGVPPESDILLDDIPHADIPLGDSSLADVPPRDISLRDTPFGDVPVTAIPLGDVPLRDSLLDMSACAKPEPENCERSDDDEELSVREAEIRAIKQRLRKVDKKVGSKDGQQDGRLPNPSAGGLNSVTDIYAVPLKKALRAHKSLPATWSYGPSKRDAAATSTTRKRMTFQEELQSSALYAQLVRINVNHIEGKKGETHESVQIHEEHSTELEVEKAGHRKDYLTEENYYAEIPQRTGSQHPSGGDDGPEVGAVRGARALTGSSNEPHKVAQQERPSSVPPPSGSERSDDGEGRSFWERPRQRGVSSTRGHHHPQERVKADRRERRTFTQHVGGRRHVEARDAPGGGWGDVPYPPPHSKHPSRPSVHPSRPSVHPSRHPSHYAAHLPTHHDVRETSEPTYHHGSILRDDRHQYNPAPGNDDPLSPPHNPHQQGRARREYGGAHYRENWKHAGELSRALYRNNWKRAGEVSGDPSRVELNSRGQKGKRR